MFKTIPGLCSVYSSCALNVSPIVQWHPLQKRQTLTLGHDQVNILPSQCG